MGRHNDLHAKQNKLLPLPSLPSLFFLSLSTLLWRVHSHYDVPSCSFNNTNYSALPFFSFRPPPALLSPSTGSRRERDNTWRGNIPCVYLWVAQKVILHSWELNSLPRALQRTVSTVSLWKNISSQCGKVTFVSVQLPQLQPGYGFALQNQPLIITLITFSFLFSPCRALPLQNIIYSQGFDLSASDIRLAGFSYSSQRPLEMNEREIAREKTCYRNGQWCLAAGIIIIVFSTTSAWHDPRDCQSWSPPPINTTSVVTTSTTVDNHLCLVSR